MSEPLRGESTAQEQAEAIARPSVSKGHFWINPYRSGSDFLARSTPKHRQQRRSRNADRVHKTPRVLIDPVGSLPAPASGHDYTTDAQSCACQERKRATFQ